MIAYIKRFADFKTVVQGEITDYTLPLGTLAADTGSIAMAVSVSPDLVGSWICTELGVYLITEIVPGNNSAQITVALPSEAFSRPITKPAQTASIGAFIKDCLTVNYKEQADTFYSLPYLEITNIDTTAFAAPEVNEHGLFNQIGRASCRERV